MHSGSKRIGRCYRSLTQEPIAVGSLNLVDELTMSPAMGDHLSKSGSQGRVMYQQEESYN